MRRWTMNDKYLTVSVINRYIKHRLDSDENLQQVFIKGERHGNSSCPWEF